MRDWPRYYALTLPHPLPDALLRTVTREFLADATRPGWLVHESVVHRLEATARACGTSLTPRVAVHDGSAPGLVTRDGPDQPSPRRTVLLFPVLLPRSFDQPYLG